MHGTQWLDIHTSIHCFFCLQENAVVLQSSAVSTPCHLRYWMQELVVKTGWHAVGSCKAPGSCFQEVAQKVDMPFQGFVMPFELGKEVLNVPGIIKRCMNHLQNFCHPKF